MKKFLLPFLILALASCSYKVSRYDYIINNKKPASGDVIIKKFLVLDGIDKIKIGTIKLDDEQGLVRKCDEAVAIEMLRSEALSVNANLVNIVEEAEPGGSSICYRCVADLYYVEFGSVGIDTTTLFARDALIYDANRRLAWADFKAELDYDDSTEHAYLFATIQMVLTKVNVWLGYVTIDAYGIVFKDVSWVKPEYANKDNLVHQQLHFDIAELFAKRLKKDINKRKINAGNKKKINEIFNSYKEDLDNYLSLYDKETNFGRNRREQKRWRDKIFKEFAQLKN